MRNVIRSLVVLVVVGCGTDKSPVEKCDDLIDVLCDRGEQCLGGAHPECVQAVQTQLPCGSAKDVSASYDRCLDQLQASSCSVRFPVNSPGDWELGLPADSLSVILTRTALGVPASPFAVSLAGVP